jgi:hypothetical protein
MLLSSSLLGFTRVEERCTVWVIFPVNLTVFCLEFHFQMMDLGMTNLQNNVFLHSFKKERKKERKTREK